MDCAVIILAAGRGERMVSRLPKVLHPVTGKPMLFYPLKAVDALGVLKKVIVIGHGKEAISEQFNNKAIEFVEQKDQLGTAHAVLMTEDRLKGWEGYLLILSGDCPLIKEDTLKALLDTHIKDSANLTIMTAQMKDPKGYGRVFRDEKGNVLRIVEEIEAKDEEKAIREINTGIYCLSSMPLFDMLRSIKPSRNKNEYYLTDIVEIAIRRGYRVSSYLHNDPLEVMGVNNRVELAYANRMMRERLLNNLMVSGVTILNPENTYIDYGVIMGKDSVVYPNVHLEGKTIIGEECVLEEGCKIIGSEIGQRCRIKSFTVIESSTIGKEVIIGPFARLRPGNHVGDNVRIGNFVEIKNSTIGSGTKANHLTYIGDSIVGENVNVGAGTITCNYDGFKKHKTVIEDGAFIGSSTQLVAPVKIGRGAYIGSGSTITKDVPPGALAISRAEQKNIDGWVEKKKKREGS